MRTRLAAAAAGAVLIAAAVLAFSLGKHPVVAGTNTAAPLYAALELRGGETRCQTVSRVPGRATHLRVVVTSIRGPFGRGRLHVTVAPREGGRLTVAGRKRVKLAGMVIRLDRKTKALHPGRVCMTYEQERGRTILAGEIKRIAPRDSVEGERERGVASIVFLRPGLSSWAARRDTIAERYANSQPGSLGKWSLWVAALLVLAGVVTALWWLAFRLEPRKGEPDSGTNEDGRWHGSELN